MAFPDFFRTSDVASVFAEEVSRLGGRVWEVCDDGDRLFARSILPAEVEVKTGDGLRGGVALMANEQEIRVHPYVFRQVCTNGAIRAHALQTARVSIPMWPAEAPATLELLREAIAACGTTEAFRQGANEMRSALTARADIALALMPFLARQGARGGQLLAMIMGRFMQDEDGNTQFGLMNAITSVARDTPDPETRWRLEELGGGVPVAVLRRRPAPTTWAALDRNVVMA